jgi:transcription-repair coupling factor (superfamily II helicase)
MFEILKNRIYREAEFEAIKNDFGKKLLNIHGVQGSLISFITVFLYENLSKKILFVTNDEEKLNGVKGDLETIINEDIITEFSADGKNEELTKTLKNLSEENEFIIFANTSELEKTIIPKNEFTENIIELEKGKQFDFESLIQKLGKYNYSKNHFVEEVGEYSVRGGIVDLFPEHNDVPLRIEFFGDTIESIREFDIATQRSVKELEKVKIGINLSLKEDNEKNTVDKGLLRDYLPSETLIIADSVNDISENILNAGSEEYNSFENYFSEQIKNKNFIKFSNYIVEDNENPEVKNIQFKSKLQPAFHSRLEPLYSNLSENIKEGFQCFILCSDENQARRMKTMLGDFESEDEEKSERKNIPSIHISDELKRLGISEKVHYIPESIYGGFILSKEKLLVYTEHQIFERYFRHIRKRKKKFRGLTFEDVKELKRGDFVVHRDFGIGIFSGLKKIKVGNSEQEAVKLKYAEDDVLFLSLNYINLIKKYSGTEGYTPKLTRLGGGEWDKIKERTKKKVKDIARDLILLYAKRKSETGFKFSEDTHWQRELEASFMFEDTPDQLSATEDVKEDMQSENPMDRLICGDVGFGKTEVAVRAAFKAVLDNKQVAILVPTTILALQHYNTFNDRLNMFAVEVGIVSRMTSKKEQTNVLNRLEEGKVNILIGTHRMLSKDIKFKDIGLLVIDEEQRFGVKAKEKLRSIKPNIDTLTLTATPIPRTLNFSLLGARDLSVINTPPKNRKPIITEIISLDWKYIKEVISNELKRGGQVYFVNDKISSLEKFADRIKEVIPIAKIGIAHGQMNGNELEDIIIDFIERKTNVLVCTKIIESGLDIPNVNTIIINNANMYGLAELYQLRGRVGRSDVQAYAYFISPPSGRLTKSAIRRLQAIEEYTELGSGFNLAMRDMEIRGVGNLLGKEQSGFVQQMGFETFLDIIDEAVSELKENEFKDLFADEKSLQKVSEKIEKKKEEKQTIIENDLNALIPKDYIENDTERLNIYKRLYALTKIDEVESIKDELKDRFGEFLEDVENLLEIIKIKIIATRTGLEKIRISGNHLELHFPNDKKHRIYESEFFKDLIRKISESKKGKYKFAEEKEVLMIQIKFESFEDKERIKEAKIILIS